MNTEEVQRILNREDIEGLLALGAPDDEYETEARTIAKEFTPEKDPLSEEAIAEMVRKVWIQAFSPLSDDGLKKRSPAFYRVARSLLELSRLSQ
jgi:hypothetical protein